MSRPTVPYTPVLLLDGLDGVAQILMLSAEGVRSVTPAKGTTLWEHSWPTGVRIVQPALTADGDLLISAGEGHGTRRIAVTREPGGWTTEERWTSNRMKPYFNDFVVHDDHAFGFDGRSRTGKMLPGKIGLLSIYVEAP